MNYQETVQYLYKCTPVFEHVGASAYKEGLANTIALDEHFQHPHRKYKTIHIAGTNGKGSCSHTLAAILQAQGYKVGLYTSPHLVDFRERIRVNGELIPEQYVVDFVANEKNFFEPLHPSFFELTTAMAFKFFAEMDVDIAVIEVGLGGRLDCTNIITAILSIITNISFDHTQFLGNTLAKIAYEKAGIIKQNIPVIIGETTTETRPVFEAKAKETNSPIIFAADTNEIVASTPTSDGRWKYQTRSFGTIEGELGGSYQLKNSNTILCALKQLGITNIKAIQKGFGEVCKLTGLMGRWQCISNNPKTICDTGHNVAGWKFISQQLKEQKYAHLHIVFGMVDDKDIDTVMSMLPKEAKYYWTQATTKRAIPKERVAEEGTAHGLTGAIFSDVHTAYKSALANSNEEDLIFIGGSSYIVADLLASL